MTNNTKRILLFIAILISFLSFNSEAQRNISADEIRNGTTGAIFKIPTVSLTAAKACSIDSSGVVESSTVTKSELLSLVGIDTGSTIESRISTLESGSVTSVNSQTGDVILTASDVGADVSGAASTVQTNLNSHTSNTSNPHSVTKSQVGLSSVDNTSDANKPISTVTQVALDLKADQTDLDTTNSNVSSHVSNTNNPHNVTKTQVGLGNVDNTSDVNKPVSSAQSTAINAAQSAAQTFAVNGDTVLQNQINLKADQTSLNTTNSNVSANTTNISTNTSNIATNTSTISSHVSNTSNPHSVTKTQVGLGNVSNVTSANLPISTATQSALDSKQDKSASNYVMNGNYEIDLSGMQLYSDVGRTVPAFVVKNDITYTSALSGSGGNGATISYVFHATQSYLTPLVTCPTGTSVNVAWYNGPTVNSNPTATQLKAAYDATPCAVAIATAAITGTAGTKQYITGSSSLGNGGDASPVDGLGGSPLTVTMARSTSMPLVGIASLILSKTASNGQGEGLSTDFEIENADLGDPIQVSFEWLASTNFVNGSASDLEIFIYDITNAALIAPSSVNYLSGANGSSHRTAVKFTASQTSTNYRLIFHTVTTNALAWDFQLDELVVSDVIDAVATTQVPSLTLISESISIAVTDHMAVMHTDGASSWVPATMASATDATTLFGFVTNINGLTADITIRGKLCGFSFGPFAGYNQYVDSASAGSISPAPSTFTDAYVVMGKGIDAFCMMVEPKTFNRLVTSKGGLLTNGGANNGTGDVVVVGGSTGQFLRYNTTLTNGFSAFTPVATAPIIYTAATSTWSCTTATDSVAGCMSAADHTSLTGKAPLASPTFTGTPTLPTGTIAVTQSAGNSTTAVGTTSFITTADNLKADKATPTFTGDINSSTGNVLVSTIGKGLQVKTGTNAKIGQAVLVAGTKTVANTSVTANSRIFLSVSATGGTPSTLSYTKIAGTSFTITSGNALDTSTVDWYIVESIP